MRPPEGRWGCRRALSPPRAVTGALGASSAGGGDGIQLAAAAAWGPLTGRASAPGLRAGGGKKGKGMSREASPSLAAAGRSGVPSPGGASPPDCHAKEDHERPAPQHVSTTSRCPCPHPSLPSHQRGTGLTEGVAGYESPGRAVVALGSSGGIALQNAPRGGGNGAAPAPSAPPAPRSGITQPAATSLLPLAVTLQKGQSPPSGIPSGSWPHPDPVPQNSAKIRRGFRRVPATRGTAALQQPRGFNAAQTPHAGPSLNEPGQNPGRRF